MELLILNTLMVVYLISSMYKLIKFRSVLSDESIHHLLSHTFIVMFFLVSVNVYSYSKCTIPLTVSFAYLLQHLVKENVRLVRTGKWTPSIKEQ